MSYVGFSNELRGLVEEVVNKPEEPIKLTLAVGGCFVSGTLSHAEEYANRPLPKQSMQLATDDTIFLKDAMLTFQNGGVARLDMWMGRLSSVDFWFWGSVDVRIG